MSPLTTRRLRRTASRLGLWRVRDRGLVVASWVAMRVLPAQRVAVVAGEPDWEGNAVEVLRGLARRYPGRIVWLREGRSPDDRAILDAATADRVTTVRAGSSRAFRLLWRAEATFFTHGLVSAVRPPDSRLVVNLWHGDGPKATTGLPRCASTVVVAATRLWAEYKAGLFGVPVEDVAVLGNPRVDSVLARSPAQTRQLLGLGTGGERVVVWLPTYRLGASRSVRYANGALLSEVVGDRITVPDGVQLLVKPHPFDTDDYAGLGARVVPDQELSGAGVTLLQLLDAADAIVSDASSAWVDSLTLDLPLGFFLPAGDTFEQARGYNVPDLRAVLPGPVLSDPAAVSDFLVDVRDGRARRPSRHEAYPRIGYSAQLPVTDHLLDWLDARRAARGARPLFTGAGRLVITPSR